MGVDALIRNQKQHRPMMQGHTYIDMSQEHVFTDTVLILQCSNKITYHLHWNLAVTISLTQNYVPRQFGDIELFSLFSL